MKYVFLFVGLFLALTTHAQQASLSEYLGKYNFQDGSTASESLVEMQGNKLQISSNLGSATLTQQKADTFSVDDYGGQIIFLRAKGAAVTGIKVNIPAASLQDVVGTKAVLQPASLNDYLGKYTFQDGSAISEAMVEMQGNKLLVSSNLGSATLTLIQADSFSVDDYGGQIVFLRAKGAAVTGIKINVPAASLQDAMGTKAVVDNAPAVAAVAAAGPREPFVKKGQVDLEAHQGGCGLCPCNTITAFINAVKLGVNTLEMDAVISKDNLVLISHDQFMDFTMRTPQGKDDITKENQLQYNIFTMPYDSVRKYDAGSRANPYFPKQRKLVTYKPLLAEVIDSVEQYVKAHGLPPVKYNIEVKSLRGDNVYHPAPGPFTDLIVKVISDKNIMNRVVIQSFDIRALQYLHAHYPAFRTSYLVGVSNKGSVQDNINRLGFVPDVYSPEFPMVTAATVEQVHGMGMNLIPWTIDKKEDMANIIRLGVDGVITNYPDVAKQLIKERK